MLVEAKSQHAPSSSTVLTRVEF